MTKNFIPKPRPLTQQEQDAIIDTLIDAMTELQRIEIQAKEKREALGEMSIDIQSINKNISKI